MDYISREAALNFEMSVECSPDEIQGITDGMALYAEYIKQLPEADVVEVVRCRKCKWWKSNDCKNDTHGYVPFDENDFCSQGKRKDGADND